MKKFQVKKYVPILILLVAVGVLVYLVASTGGPSSSSSALDSFGRCLKSKGATMYGAYWCPHCQNEKKVLGAAMDGVKYVECTQETDLCAQKGIKGYPTWTFADGSRFEGEQGIDGLVKATGCPTPL